MEAVKAMIHDQDLPMNLWAEATGTVVYVQKRGPHRVLGNKTVTEEKSTLTWKEELIG